MIKKENRKGSVLYLNSGDWIENLTALEYNKKRWKMYQYTEETKAVEEEYFELETELSHQLIATLIFNKK